MYITCVNCIRFSVCTIDRPHVPPSKGWLFRRHFGCLTLTFDVSPMGGWSSSTDGDSEMTISPLTETGLMVHSPEDGSLTTTICFVLPLQARTLSPFPSVADPPERSMDMPFRPLPVPSWEEVGTFISYGVTYE